MMGQIQDIYTRIASSSNCETQKNDCSSMTLQGSDFTESVTFLRGFSGESCSKTQNFVFQNNGTRILCHMVHNKDFMIENI